MLKSSNSNRPALYMRSTDTAVDVGFVRKQNVHVITGRTVLRTTPWTTNSDFSAVGLRQAVLDPKIDEEHDARISFGHRPLGHCMPARARVKFGRSAHSGRQPGRQPACMHCMHKNRLNFIMHHFLLIM